MRMIGAGLVITVLVGCGGGDDDPMQPIDAAPTASVLMVDCAAATIAQTVTTANFAFTPAAISITVDDVLRFMPESLHNVIPHPTLPTDSGLRSGPVGQERCLRFTAAGEFNYRCEPHSQMMGRVTVNE